MGGGGLWWLRANKIVCIENRKGDEKKSIEWRSFRVITKVLAHPLDTTDLMSNSIDFSPSTAMTTRQ